jgi:membrane-bound lytic murein transglycosylase A
MVWRSRATVLLLGGIAVTIVLVLLLRGKTVDDEVVSFAQVTFAELDGWQADDQALAFQALLKSCGKASAKADTDAHASNGGASICAEALALGSRGEVGRDAARAFFEAHYTPYRVLGAHKPGLVTGYYEPEVDGARERGPRFKVPVYRRPDDLVALTPDEMRARFNDRLTAMRQTSDGLVPYFTREEIDRGALEGRGLEILYLADPVELFFMQVQGSGCVRLADGTTPRLGYAGKNGHPYTSISKLLVERGEGKARGKSMQVIKDWLRADALRGRRLMWKNRSYVFFQEREEEDAGPIGAQGVALTPGRSLAVDASYHALGLPIFVDAAELKGPDDAPFRRLMIAQDVGSAIRGPERGDIFWGSGEAAGLIAGSTLAPARFTVLLPSPAPGA